MDDDFKFIICFDGGGSRGYFSICIADQMFSKGFKLFENADLIGGTSTGGIIALAKATTEISNEDLKKLYVGKDAKDLFSKLKVIPRLITSGELSNSTKLVSIVEETLKNNEEKKKQIDFFVVSLKKDVEYKNQHIDDAQGSDFVKSLEPVIISNYKQNKYNLDQFEGKEDYNFILDKFKYHSSYEISSGPINNETMKASDAIRCTAGIPVVFKLFEKNSIEFYDGGVKYNNPIGFAYLEARQKYLTSNLIIISIGTGTNNIPHEVLKDKNKETNIILSQLLDNISKKSGNLYQTESLIVEVKKIIRHIKELREIGKYQKESSNTNDQFDEFREILKCDKKAFFFRFDNHLKKDISFFDVSDEAKIQMDLSAKELADTNSSEQFDESVQLFNRIVNLKKNNNNNPNSKKME